MDVPRCIDEDKEREKYQESKKRVFDFGLDLTDEQRGAVGLVALLLLVGTVAYIASR